MNLFRHIAALAVLCTTPLFAATVQPDFDPLYVEYRMPEWRSVGHDTCKQNPGCTATWAMNAFQDTNVLPAIVATQARAAFAQAEMLELRGETPDWTTFQVCEGDVVASSFSNKDAELTTVRQIKATFAGCTPGLGWTFIDYETGESYEVFRVIECGNYTARRVVPAVAGHVPSPRFAALTSQHHVSQGGFAIFAGASTGGSVTTASYLSNVTNVVYESCTKCSHPVPDYPDHESLAPVPLPASGLMLGFALLAFVFGLRVLNIRKSL